MITIQTPLCKLYPHPRSDRRIVLIDSSYAGFTPSSTYLFSSTLSSILRIYNIHTSKVLKTFRHASYVSERFPCPAIIFPRPKKALPPQVNGNLNGNGDAIEVDTENLNSDAQNHGTGPEAWLISGSENGKIVIWDVGSRGVVAILEGHERPVVALAVRPDGKRIATGSLEPEKSIRIWSYDAESDAER